MDLKIIYEDNHIIVVNKPCAVMSQEDISKTPDMVNLIKKYLKEKYNKPGQVYVGLIHRLDTVTSGIMVFAKTSKAASRLSDQVRQNKIAKEYLAVFEEKVIPKNDLLVDYLYKNSSKNIVSVTDNKEMGKLSKLNYEVIGYKDTMSLVKIKLITGRSHQIRVQFSSRGFHIYGDAKYGAKNKDKKAIALHAYSLEFEHPTKKEIMKFSIKPEREPFNMFDF